MSGVPKSNRQLEEALAGVTDTSQLRETLLKTLSDQGQIVKNELPVPLHPGCLSE